MDSEEYAAAFIVYYILSDETKTAPSSRRKRKVWVKPWLSRRNEHWFYDTIMQEFRSEDVDEYQRFLRMSPALFDEILCLIENDATKEYTVFRDPIPAKINFTSQRLFSSLPTSMKTSFISCLLSFPNILNTVCEVQPFR